MDPERDRPKAHQSATDSASDLLNAVAVIRARAQLTRRRVRRDETLDRDHLVADLEQIEDQALRLAVLIDPSQADSRTHARAALAAPPPEAVEPPAPG